MTIADEFGEKMFAEYHRLKQEKKICEFAKSY